MESVDSAPTSAGLVVVRRVGGGWRLFDLGDLHALAPRKILRITDIFISHCHMDHFMGFDWWLRICLGRERGVRLYGPPGFIDQIEGARRSCAPSWNGPGGVATKAARARRSGRSARSSPACRLQPAGACQPH